MCMCMSFVWTIFQYKKSRPTTTSFCDRFHFFKFLCSQQRSSQVPPNSNIDDPPSQAPPIPPNFIHTCPAPELKENILQEPQERLPNALSPWCCLLPSPPHFELSPHAFVLKTFAQLLSPSFWAPLMYYSGFFFFLAPAPPIWGLRLPTQNVFVLEKISQTYVNLKRV